MIVCTFCVGMLHGWQNSWINATIRSHSTDTMTNFDFRPEGSRSSRSEASFMILPRHLVSMHSQRLRVSTRFMKTVCSCAAEGGHLHILQWARENDCPWDKYTCVLAAGGGHLHILQWARENGCPWDEDTCLWAADSGHLHILQWARENGCPWNPNECLERAIGTQHRDMKRWIEENSIP